MNNLYNSKSHVELWEVLLWVNSLEYESSFKFLLTAIEGKNTSLVSFQRNQEAFEKDKMTPVTSADDFCS